MTHYLKPHTAEWFKVLETVNPLQAAHTKHILSLAASDAVCSICGDESNRDYEPVNAETTHGLSRRCGSAMIASTSAALCATRISCWWRVDSGAGSTVKSLRLMRCAASDAHVRVGWDLMLCGKP